MVRFLHRRNNSWIGFEKPIKPKKLDIDIYHKEFQKQSTFTWNMSKKFVFCTSDVVKLPLRVDLCIAWDMAFVHVSRCFHDHFVKAIVCSLFCIDFYGQQKYFGISRIFESPLLLSMLKNSNCCTSDSTVQCVTYLLVNTQDISPSCSIKLGLKYGNHTHINWTIINWLFTNYQLNTT